MDGQAGAGIKLLVADMTFKMLCFLVLDKNLLIVKVPVAVPAPGLQLLLLLPAHDDNASKKN